MKASSSFIELVIIMVLLIGCIPLLGTLVIVMNSSKLEYLEDKTVVQSKMSIEYNLVGGKLVPSYVGNLKLKREDIILMYLIYDSYAPNTNKVKLSFTNVGTSVYDFSSSHNVQYKIDNFTWNYGSDLKLINIPDSDIYMYWNGSNWDISTQNKNIYE